MSGYQVGPSSWSEDEIATLKTGWGKGRSAQQIAMGLNGRSRSAVCGMARRLGLSARLSPAHFQTCTKAVKATRTPKAPPVRCGPASPRGAKRTPPKQGPHLKPGAVFGPVATLDPIEAQKRSDAQAAAGRKLVEAFAAPANDDAILLIERRFGQCSWPVGEPDRPATQLCCGRKVPADSNRAVPTYCSAHALKAISRTRLGGAPDAKAYERSLRRVA